MIRTLTKSYFYLALLTFILFFSSIEAKNIYFISVPKSGTRIFASILSELTGKEINYWKIGNSPLDKEKIQFQHFDDHLPEYLDCIMNDPDSICFLLKRDLRDVIVSAYYMSFNEPHIIISDVEYYNSLNKEDKISYIMKHSWVINSAHKCARCIKKHASNDRFVVISYEEMVGLTPSFIEKLSRIESNTDLVERVAERTLNSERGTKVGFRNGKTHDYIDEFSPKNMDSFSFLKKLNKQLGYNDDSSPNKKRRKR